MGRSRGAQPIEEVVEAGGRVSQAMQAFRTFLGETDMLAYLAMMAPRLMELRRVLKPTGSHIPALRSDGEPLPEDADGCRLRRRELPERDHLEADVRPRCAKPNGGRIHDILLLYTNNR